MRAGREVSYTSAVTFVPPIGMRMPTGSDSLRRPQRPTTVAVRSSS